MGLVSAAAVFTAAVGISRAQTTVDIRAQLSPRNYTTLSSELAAKIASIAVREGDRFSKGQVLVGMECSLQRANLEKARAALSAAEKTSDVNRRLQQMNAAGALEAEVAAADATKARAEVAAGLAVVSKCAVAAPFAGRVAELKVRAQQFVQPGQAMLEIIDDSVLEIEFLAPSAWLVWLKPGQDFHVAIDETAKTYPARVARLGARVDPVSQSVKVVAEINGKFPELMAGMSGRIVLVPPQ